MSRPYLDVTAVLLDPELAETVIVIRRPQVISGQGRVTIPEPRRFEGVVAVVTMAHPNDLERLDDNDRTGRVLCVITKFDLRATSPGFKPDLVVWRGDSYVVKALDPYVQYGPGFVQALCGSQDAQDRPAGEVVGAEQFDSPSNAVLTGAT